MTCSLWADTASHLPSLFANRTYLMPTLNVCSSVWNKTVFMIILRLTCFLSTDRLHVMVRIKKR